MDNDSRHGLRPDNPDREVVTERIFTPAEHERHYAPLNRELHADDARKFGWTAENGTIQSYQHAGTQRHIHIDGPSGQFYDQQKNPISQYAALDRAAGPGNHHAPDPAKMQEVLQQPRVDRVWVSVSKRMFGTEFTTDAEAISVGHYGKRCTCLRIGPVSFRQRFFDLLNLWL